MEQRAGTRRKRMDRHDFIPRPPEASMNPHDPIDLHFTKTKAEHKQRARWSIDNRDVLGGFEIPYGWKKAQAICNKET